MLFELGSERVNTGQLQAKTHEVLTAHSIVSESFTEFSSQNVPDGRGVLGLAASLLSEKQDNHLDFNPFTPKSDQFEISPGLTRYNAPRSMKNLAFQAYSDER